MGEISWSLELETREAVCYKPSLTSHPDGNLEKQTLGRNVESWGPDPEVSEGNSSVRSWTRGPFCYILAKNLAEFCHCPGNMSEAEFKSDMMIWWWR